MKNDQITDRSPDEAIVILREHLKAEENELANNLEIIKAQETKIASYRLLIGEQTF